MEERERERICKLLLKRLSSPEDLYLIQSIEEQKMFVCRGNGIVEEYDASTSRFGAGIRENSFKTPPGLHRICDMIGSGAPEGRIFKGRCDTGTDWEGIATEENLILTRILRLEGLEPGINKGPGVDSYDRFIYIHGTNQVEKIGTPLSHGCIVMRSRDIVRLYASVEIGTLVYVEPPPLKINDAHCRSIHLVGIFGTGMSALAQYLRFNGFAVSGSDRLLDSTDTESMRVLLADIGCTIMAQDGSGVHEGTDAVCVSSAIEETNPEILAARKYAIPVIHRSDLLAAIIETKEAIAVAGTSGKSTVTAMIFEFLSACGRSPSLISGAPLRRLERQGLIGNAYSGASELLVVEADESDGTLVKYGPKVSVVLNISKDHRDIEEIQEFFRVLLSHSEWTVTNADDPLLEDIDSDATFGKGTSASWHPDEEVLLARAVKLSRKGLLYELPYPGRHNLENLRAALCICEHLGCDGAELSQAVKAFEGVSRRFTLFETNKQVYVVDDFAHNPAKISAVVQAARGVASRIIAVYQPHGYGPTRFLRQEYVSTFQQIFQNGDVLVLLPIYYAGGTAVKDITSNDIIRDLTKAQVPFYTEAVPDREHLLSLLREKTNAGDCVLLMGARDPSLPVLAQNICSLFGGLIANQS